MRIVEARSVLLAAGVMLGGALLAGCGEEAPKAQVPVAGGGVVGAGDLSGKAQPGQVWTASDTPSSGDVDQSRPKMNDAAASSYKAGINAFVAGDLQTAKKLFTDAT